MLSPAEVQDAKDAITLRIEELAESLDRIEIKDLLLEALDEVTL